ncbi:hypothetical protein BFL35_00100 [Clavibacter michiganensis]|nr:hypothetical protein BFL35_00100 [Clavibacter michiganensis]
MLREAAERDLVGHGERLVGILALADLGDAAGDPPARAGAHVLAVDRHPAARERHGAHERPQQRGLAAAVRADDAGHGSGRRLERHVVEQDAPARDHAHGLGADHGSAASSPASSAGPFTESMLGGSVNGNRSATTRPSRTAESPETPGAPRNAATASSAEPLE